MSTKGKQLSVIVAGATGSLGQELVSRLVSHPDVSRVVALARHPIPVNRWTSVFPHLHIGDARRYLSVVPVDWEKVLADASHIPLSYVQDGVWRPDDATAEWHRFERHRRRAAARSSRTATKGTHGHHLFHHFSGSSSSNGSIGSSNSLSPPMSNLAQGYIKVPARWVDDEAELDSTSSRNRLLSELHQQEQRVRGTSGDFDTNMVNSWSGTSTTAASGSARKSARSDEAEQRRWSQEYLRQFLQNSFYRSVFSGHQVAINCIGTSHVLSSAELTLVDYDLSMAFAKIVRLFNCMAHAEPSEDEERLLVEATSHELDSVLWNEIYAACYGKSNSSSGISGVYPTGTKESLCDAGTIDDGGQTTSPPTSPSNSNSSSSGPESFDSAGTAIKPKEQRHWMNRGEVATLRHFSQVSVRAANELSPLPYLRTHGRRDRHLLKLFSRLQEPSRFSARGLRMRPRTDTHGVAQPVVTLPVPPLSPIPSPRTQMPSWWSPLRGLFYGLSPESPSDAAVLSRIGSNVNDGDDRPIIDQQQQRQHALAEAAIGEAAARGDAEEVARQRAQMLLRRDVVKIWEQANLTIWRPGLFTRRGQRRLMEALVSLAERPVDVRCLAECIVDDVIDTFYQDTTSQPHRGHRQPVPEPQSVRIGKTKIINGRSVARRTHMKALEDGLNEMDTQHASTLR